MKGDKTPNQFLILSPFRPHFIKLLLRRIFLGLASITVFPVLVGKLPEQHNINSQYKAGQCNIIRLASIEHAVGHSFP